MAQSSNFISRSRPIKCRFTRICSDEARIPERASDESSANPNNLGHSSNSERKKVTVYYQLTMNYFYWDSPPSPVDNPGGGDSAISVPGSSRKIINAQNYHLYDSQDILAAGMHDLFTQMLHSAGDHLISLEYEVVNGVNQATLNVRKPHTSYEAFRTSIEKYTVSYKYEKVKESSENSSTLEKCPICLYDFEDDESIRRLQCTHFFHIACIDQWLSSKKRCPMCRQNVIKTVTTK